MKKFVALIGVALCVLFFILLLNTMTRTQEAVSQEYVPNEVLVKFKKDVDPKIIQGTIDSVQASIVTHQGTEISSAEWDVTLMSTRSLLADPTTFHLKVPASMGTMGAIAALKALPYVEYAEPNGIVHLSTIPNDTRFSELWGMHNTGQSGGTPGADIKAPEAWNIFTGSSDMVVAVIDTGIDYNHVDLQANIWVNTDEIPGNGIDDDGNGYVDDYRGWNFVSNNNNPMDDCYPIYHGTHVSGTIGAVGNNSTGVTGVNWNVKLMALKAFDSTGNGTNANIANAIDYATMNGARISSNSYGGSAFSYTLYYAVMRALAAGDLFVAAAGNDSSNDDTTPVYPACFNLNNVVSVLATNQNDNLANYSNYGNTSVDLGAPGGSLIAGNPAAEILSTQAGNTYGWLCGTSMATPHVAGVAALARGKCSALTYSQLKSRIMTKVDVLSSLTGKCVSGGRVNAYKTIYDPAAPNGTPGNFAATPTGWTTIKLTWTDNSTNEIGFEAQRKTSSMPDYVYLNSADANATRLDDLTATAGTAYYFRVRAYNMAGNSGFTAEASALIPASSPAAPIVIGAHWDWGHGAVHLTWNDRSNNEEYFYVERKAEGETTWQQIAELDQNVTEYYDSDVYGDTTYYYRVKSSNPLGSAYSGSIMVYVPAH